MGEHLAPISDDEPWIMPKHRRNVPNFHPALGSPPQELDFFTGQMVSTYYCSRAIVFFSAAIVDEPLIAEILGHGRARIGSGVLDVRPIDVSSGKLKVGIDRLSRIAGIAND